MKEQQSVTKSCCKFHCSCLQPHKPQALGKHPTLTEQPLVSFPDPQSHCEPGNETKWLSLSSLSQLDPQKCIHDVPSLPVVRGGGREGGREGREEGKGGREGGREGEEWNKKSKG